MFFGFWFVQIKFVENNKIEYKSSSKIGFSWPSFRCFSSFSRRFSFLFQFKQFRIMNSKLQKCVTFCLSWSFKIDSILFVTEWLLLCIVSFVPYFFIVFFLSIDAVMRKRYHQVTKWDKHEPNRKCVLNIIVVSSYARLHFS